jgi:hypothetical protein
MPVEWIAFSSRNAAPPASFISQDNGSGYAPIAIRVEVQMRTGLDYGFAFWNLTAKPGYEISSFSRGAASGPFLPNRVDLMAKGMAFS